MEANVIKFPKYICSFCKKNEATQLCDFVVGYFYTTAKSNYGRQYETCDNQMCKECLVKHTTFEFCPSCNKLHKLIKLKHDKRSNRLLIDFIFATKE